MPQTSRDPFSMQPREGLHDGEDRGAFLPISEPLRDRGIAPTCAPGPAPPHAASVEALLGSARASCALDTAPPSDEESACDGSTDCFSERGSLKRSVAAPLRLLRSNQLAG